TLSGFRTSCKANPQLFPFRHARYSVSFKRPSNPKSGLNPLRLTGAIGVPAREEERGHFNRHEKIFVLPKSVFSRNRSCLFFKRAVLPASGTDRPIDLLRL